MSLRLKNDTTFRTDDLKLLVRYALRERGVADRLYWVRVHWNRRRWTAIGGWGSYHVPHFRLTIPYWMRGRDLAPEEIELLCKVALHEIDHTLGLRHGEMICMWREMPVPAWAAGLVVRLKVATEKKPKEPLTVRRAEHVAKMLERAERRLKIAQTVAKRWRVKQRYYERKAAAAPRLPSGPEGAVS